MTATINVTEDSAMTALIALLQALMPAGTTVLSGQQNFVALPEGQCIICTPIDRIQLDKPYREYDRLNQAASTLASKEWRVQLDVYGDNAADNASMIATAFSSAIATEFFSSANAPIQALYADTPQNMQFINESSNYENRWRVDVHLQINESVTMPQEFAEHLDVGLHEVDTTYPPQ